MPWQLGQMDFGGDIIARSGAAAANNIMEGFGRFGQGIMTGASKIGDELEKAAITKEQLDQLDQTAKLYTERGQMTAERLEKFLSGSKGQKTAIIQDLMARDSLSQKLQLAAARKGGGSGLVYSKGEPGRINPQTGQWESVVGGTQAQGDLQRLVDPVTGKVMFYKAGGKVMRAPKDSGDNMWMNGADANGESEGSTPMLNLTLPEGADISDGDMSRVEGGEVTVTKQPEQTSAPVTPVDTIGYTPEQARAELARRRKLREKK